jgi:hypothetical protein
MVRAVSHCTLFRWGADPSLTLLLLNMLTACSSKRLVLAWCLPLAYRCLTRTGAPTVDEHGVVSTYNHGWQQDPSLRSRVSLYASKFRTLPRISALLKQIDEEDAVVLDASSALIDMVQLMCESAGPQVRAL